MDIEFIIRMPDEPDLLWEHWRLVCDFVELWRVNNNISAEIRIVKRWFPNRQNPIFWLDAWADLIGQGVTNLDLVNQYLYDVYEIPKPQFRLIANMDDDISTLLNECFSGEYALTESESESRPELRPWVDFEFYRQGDLSSIEEDWFNEE